MTTFTDAGLPVQILQSLDRLKFTVPTPIQSQAIPPALAGRDVLATAETGTGKTLAFGIPLVTKLIQDPRARALILAPTRELATQVMTALQQILGDFSVARALLIGGESMGPQLKQLKDNPRLVVGTPGRINDHLERRTLRLHQTNMLVLDEADRMLDMGFGHQIEEIARYLTATRQTFMFSATLPPNIIKMVSRYLVDPLRITIGVSTSASKAIIQEQLRVNDVDKYDQLESELDKREGSILVFVKTRRGAEKLAIKLCRRKFDVQALHGNLRQNKRNEIIAGFRKAKWQILVATDIAARGLDIPHISHVINYDLPQSPEDYIHRIGRTARAGASGRSLTLLTPSDQRKWKDIVKFMNPKQEKSYKVESQGHTPKWGASKRADIEVRPTLVRRRRIVSSASTMN